MISELPSEVFISTLLTFLLYNSPRAHAHAPTTAMSEPIANTKEDLSKDAVDPPKPSYWSTEIAFPPRAYIPVLLLLSLAAGAIDVFSVPALGVFVANNVSASWAGPRT